MTYRTVESYAVEKPLEIDSISSKTTVYLRKNIVAVPNVGTDGEEAEGTHWKMEEAQLTHEQYREYQKSKETADLIAETSAIQNEEIMQALSDAEADREIQAIAETENTEAIMQAISDLQADIELKSLDSE